MNIFSSFFGSSSSGSFGLGSINFSEYRMIKNGSYKKALKAYYAEQSGTSKSSKTEATKKLMENTGTKDANGLTKMKSEADSLQTAAEAFEKEDVFKQKDGKYDTDKVVKTVNDFVNKYNSTIDQAGKTTSKEVAQQVGYMRRMTSTMSKALEKAGISVGVDGKLSVDEEALKKADMKDVKALFSGKGSYASDIAGKAGAIENAVLRDTNFYTKNGMFSNTTSNLFNGWM